MFGIKNYVKLSGTARQYDNTSPKTFYDEN